MMQPNWFDKKHERTLERATAEEALKIIASDERIISAIRDSLAERDANAKKLGWAGPSRSQTVRTRLAEVLQEA